MLLVPEVTMGEVTLPASEGVPATFCTIRTTALLSSLQPHDTTTGVRFSLVAGAVQASVVEAAAGQVGSAAAGLQNFTW
jgi:hypothetical protein